MAKQRIGSIKQKILVEGDPNLLNENEILVIDKCGCGCNCDITLKQLDSEHKMHTMILLNVEEYLKSLEDAYKQGYEECKEECQSKHASEPEVKQEEPYVIGLDS